MIVGVITSLATGASLPILAMFFGQMTNTFIRQTAAVAIYRISFFDQYMHSHYFLAKTVEHHSCISF